jgi:hypothetical protein
MYSWEIENFIKERNNVLTTDEFVKVVNKVDNPQIEDVKKLDNVFEISTKDGYKFIVQA